MPLPDLPELGSRELLRWRERSVLTDAELWRERPNDVNASMLMDSVDAMLVAREAWQATIRGNEETAPANR